MRKLLLIALVMVTTAPAHAEKDAFCADLERITKEGETGFVHWRGEPESDGMERLRQYPSTFELDGAAKCEIDAYSATSPTFSCQWNYPTYDDAGAKEQELLQEIRSCLAGNEIKERTRLSMNGGGRVSSLYLNMGWLLPQYLIKRQEFSSTKTGVFLKVQANLRKDEATNSD